MIDIQETNIRSGLDILEASPPNTSLPRLDERSMTWVYPTFPQWIDPQPFVWRTAAIDINGAQAAVDDDDTATALVLDRGDQRRIATQGACYYSMQINLGGGTVTPILFQVSMVVVDLTGVKRAIALVFADVANPGKATVGPIYVPPGAVLRVANFDVGGAGDTFNLAAYSLINEIGNPPSIGCTPSLTNVST